ncbi:hypothetical protein H4R33_002187 [Dimargaris cristalligena]|uniref:NADH dehydrogenase [ubiquinone] 1 beta subcomplex subunit 9 n=1 Tax=Dimargaris cristalligena TaxID=215637 RepID=A0A4P9ZR53_9FUNG|nr:hypothetical protein H4R33_002187 [Dimargaris cristalligena]RKP35984.1 NADH dehydrogenase 1 beta subcomplex 9 [Dimargaris cristalligena]|eukprot:RKP35984.1 NADH dehydrogenase 1 beta subcomplex 9 [Dimargaris cristalligena]
MSSLTPHTKQVCGLYRQALRSTLDWIVERDQWRQCAVSIRLRIEENRHVSDPRAVAHLLKNFRAEVAELAHPEPYRPPSAPGGNLWERNKLWENGPPPELLK